MMEAESEFSAHAHRIQSFLSLNLSETDTRVHLVDPVLRILGYHDIGDIRREVPIPTSKEFIDYELRIDGHPVAIVEAKALRHSITDQDAAQCVQYASILGAPWCLISNGAVWHVYYAKVNIGPLASKKVAQVRLDGDDRDLADAWRVLSLVARDSIAQANPLIKLLVERVVIDELRRPDSPAIAALRKAVRDRFHEQVPSHMILDVVDHLKDSRLVSEPIARVAPGRLPGDKAVVKRVGQTPQGTLPLSLLVQSGLLPSEATIECSVYGVTHAARVREGRIELGGKLYDSPSAAASALRDGKASNGWTMWKYHGETLAALRTRLAGESAADAGTA